jgi:hypothetical protein
MENNIRNASETNAIRAILCCTNAFSCVEISCSWGFSETIGKFSDVIGFSCVILISVTNHAQRVKKIACKKNLIPHLHTMGFML